MRTVFANSESYLYKKLKWLFTLYARLWGQERTVNCPLFLKIFGKYYTAPNIATSPRFPIYCTSYEVITTKVTPEINHFTTQKDTKAEFCEYINQMKTIYPNFIEMYTDGSKMEEGTGAACYNKTTGETKVIGLHKNSTVFSAEVRAIEEALLSIKHHHQDCIRIFTDSQSALQAILDTKVNTTRSLAVVHCKQMLLELKNNNEDIQVVWIPGHTGIPGNEIVDKLAKAAIRESPKPNEQITINDFKLHHMQIVRSREGKKPKPLYISKSLNRQDLTTIMNIKHKVAMTPTYQHRIRLADSANCICGQRGDINHMLLGCTQYTTQIRKFISEICAITGLGPFSIQNLVATSNIAILKALLRHIRRCKMKL